MDKIKIRELLNKKYERDDFKNLTQSIFKNCNYFNSPKTINPNNDKILNFLQLGNINLSDGKNLAIFELKLRKDTNIYKNKVELRNLTAKYIDQATNHGVFVVYDNQSDDYRLTFATKYSEIDQKGIFVKKETEAKRFSYLLGSNESCTTPAERLKYLFDLKNNAKLEDVIDAFNVDKISEEFFQTYKNLYFELYDEIDKVIKKDKSIELEFKSKNISTELFAKKTLSQIVFLFFLQKKGWLGIKRDKNGDFDKWGSGPKDFLNKLFNKEYSDYNNFFNDILEHLFYTALSTDLTENYFRPLDCKIPFLNGGLFEPINNYNWLKTKILIENKTIKKIFDIFSQYNFTVNENDAFEQEVAVDPEMLGKTFEKLLEVKDRKNQGVYYTPKEIVKFMCEETLITYLIDKFKDREVPNNFINKFILEPNCKINSSYKDLYLDLDIYLKDIKICDPAVGSGAFVVEILNIISKCRNRLNIFFENSKRNEYKIKYHTIQNCIYGVDKEAHAIEITKLRMWLSLVVDENDYEKINALPNLDYKITEGNSLFSVDLNIFNFDLFSKIEKLKKQFYSSSNIKEKNELKKNIKKHVVELTNDNVNFDYKVYFSEVFKEDPGFDIILCNPPYVDHKRLRNISKNLKDEYKENYSGSADLYVYFYFKALKLLKDNGNLIFITSNKFFKTKYGLKLRKILLQNNIKLLLDLNDTKVFDALVSSCIVQISKQKNTKNIFYADTKNGLTKLDNLRNYLIENITKIPKPKDEFSLWSFDNIDNIFLKDKIEKNAKLIKNIKSINIFRGITSGHNEAFIIDKKIKDLLLKQDKSSKEIIYPLIQGRDIKRYKYPNSDFYFINSHNGYKEYQRIDIPSDYKAIFNHLKKFKTELEERSDKGYHWTNLRSCSYIDSFFIDKIVWSLTSDKWSFSIDKKKCLAPSNTYIMISSEIPLNYILGILNSKLMEFYFSFIGIMTAGGAYTLKHETINNLPLKIGTTEEINKLQKLVDKIFISKSRNDYKSIELLEDKINEIVFDIYNLNKKEKKRIIE